MTVRIGLHRFESDPALPQRDGVNLAHSEINRLLDTAAPSGLDARFHDFDRLLRDDAHARATLADIDCVLCNVGPHAHYYHWLREKLGLRFRIVRDIKTALWSGYLLQESLCRPLLREGDALLATSHYSRELTRRVFPHLREHPVHLFEPVLAAAHERDVPPPRAPRSGAGPVVLGYLGRLSEDKNFPQVVDLLVDLNRSEPGRYKLRAVGAIHSASCASELVAAQVEARTGRRDLFEYHPPVPHSQVGDVLRGFDWFLFFSTSNLEVLGRVLIEAAHGGVPVIAADHAAAHELVDASSLVEVSYHAGKQFHSHFDLPLGVVDIAAAAQVIRRGAVPKPPPEAEVNHPETLMTALMGGPQALHDDGPDNLAAPQRRLLDSLQWADLPEYATKSAALAEIGRLLEWFLALNGKRGSDFAARLSRLEELSRFKERTHRFIAGTARTRCDFTNLGGIDIELCNVASYHPRFSLGPFR